MCQQTNSDNIQYFCQNNGIIKNRCFGSWDQVSTRPNKIQERHKTLEQIPLLLQAVGVSSVDDIESRAAQVGQDAGLNVHAASGGGGAFDLAEVGLGILNQALKAAFLLLHNVNGKTAVLAVQVHGFESAFFIVGGRVHVEGKALPPQLLLDFESACRTGFWRRSFCHSLRS